MDWESDPELKALRDDFISSLGRRAESLRAQIAALHSNPADPAAPHEIRVIAHNLAGCAGSYGFETLGKLSSELDDYFYQEKKIDQAKLSELALELLKLIELTSCAGSPVSGAKT